MIKIYNFDIKKGIKERKLSLTNINSLMIAILLSSNFIVTIFASLGLAEEGLLPIFFIVSLLISYIVFLFEKNKEIKIYKKVIYFIMIIILFFMISFLKLGVDSYTSDYFYSFLAFGLIIYFITLLPFTSRKVVYYSMIMGNFILLNPLQFVEYISLNTAISRISMGSTYAILPSVVATIIYFSFFRNKKITILEIISLFSNLYLLTILVTKGTRGALLSIIILIIFTVSIKIAAKMNNKYLLPTFTLFTGVIIILSLFNIEVLFNLFSDMLQRLGINSATILKTQELMMNEGIVGALNHRDSLYLTSFNMIKESPIIGQGIGSFAEQYDGSYPHNLFLQVLIEGGLLFFIPFAFIIILFLNFMIKPWLNNEKFDEVRLLMLFLCVISIPRLMLSSYLWQNQSFWLFAFVVITLFSERNTYKTLE